MTTAQLAIICITILVLAAGAAATSLRARQTPAPEPFEASARARLDVPLETHVAVHLLSGTSVRGRVVESGEVVRLADASIMAGGQESALGGVARLHDDRIEWIQELGT